MVDNALSPHGGKLVERVLGPEKALSQIQGLKSIAVRGQIATECIDIAYGFFSPLEGFMGRADVESVAREMRLASGYVWSVPVIFDLSDDEIKQLGLKEGETLLLTYQGEPLATFEVEEIYSYDKAAMAERVYGTTEEQHPGVRRTYAYKDRFLGGKITLVNPPKIDPPFDRFWFTPRQFRERFAEKGWKRVVAHQSRNVPHVGHEWLMKSAWFAADADAVLVSAVIGEKKPGDFIDEAIVLGHAMLGEAGYFQEGVHMTSILLWDMRYAGPREAVFHAIVRKNMGCTHHMFGRDHAGVGKYYDPYAAHQIFDEIPDIGIKPVETLEWWFCPVCGVAYEKLCGHRDQKQVISGTWLRSIIQEGVRPEAAIFRPEVFDLMLECGQKYGFGSPFVEERYLENRNPVFTLPAMELSRR
ncbi:MAG: sulfate adenylyltransferase [Dehalococcoidia bacterium]